MDLCWEGWHEAGYVTCRSHNWFSSVGEEKKRALSGWNRTHRSFAFIGRIYANK